MATVSKSHVSIGPVNTTTTDTRQDLTVNGWRLCVFSTDTGKPRIRDLDLAERLGYAHPLNIRNLIRRLIAERKLSGVHVVSTVKTTRMPKHGGVREVHSDEFWLTEAQALKVIARSETDVADQILDEMIEVFQLALHGLLSPARANSAETRLALFLLSERHRVARFLKDSLITEICRIYGYGHLPGNQPPQFFRMVAERIYAIVFGKEVHAEMRRRGDKRKYYELLNDDAHKLAQHDLDVLETIARQSFSPDEFWMRVESHFNGTPLQGVLVA